MIHMERLKQRNLIVITPHGRPSKLREADHVELLERIKCVASRPNMILSHRHLNVIKLHPLTHMC